MRPKQEGIGTALDAHAITKYGPIDPPHPTMARGNRPYIHPSVKKVIFSMSSTLPSSEIARLVGVHKRTVNRVVRLATETGSVIREPLQAGRPRTLTGLDIAVGYLSRLFSKAHTGHTYTVFRGMH